MDVSYETVKRIFRDEFALLKALANSPTDRYQSVNQFYKALMVNTNSNSDSNTTPGSQADTLIVESLAAYAKHLCLGCMTYFESPLGRVEKLGYQIYMYFRK